MHKDTSVSTKQTPPHDAVQPPETASAPPEAVQPPATARVVIIGGGIMGCGLAYHLAGEGCSDVVLLEKGELTSGSTWHAAGQITYATSSYTLAKCVAYNLDLYRRLEAETGQSVTFHGCGSLRMAYDEDEVDWHRHILAIVAGLELPAEILSVEEARRLHPFYNFARHSRRFAHTGRRTCRPSRHRLCAGEGRAHARRTHRPPLSRCWRFPLAVRRVACLHRARRYSLRTCRKRRRNLCATNGAVERL